MKKILFVCLGNICRSPTAEAVFRKLSCEYKYLELHIDSCGTIGYHQGNPPDPRSIKAGLERGYDLSNIRSRKISKNDLQEFDLILAMDNQNLSNLIELDEDNLYKNKIKLFLKYSKDKNITCVPDPYYGGHSGFDNVINLIEQASIGLINELVEKL